MALSVIGSGFGRTGTRSLKDALDLLGFGPCHHMEEVFPNPAQIDHWCAVARGEPVDWTAVFDGYGSQIDWPGAHVWRELAAAYPDAKVIHSVRPEDSWWNSFDGTIGKFLVVGDDIPLPPPVAMMGQAVGAIVGAQTFGGRAADRDHAIATYHAREAEVPLTLTITEEIIDKYCRAVRNDNPIYRDPDAAELDLAMSYLNGSTLAQYAQALLSSNEVIFWP